MSDAGLWTVAEAAAEIGVTRDVIRYWDRLFGITPARRPGGARLYSLAELDVLRGVAVLIFERGFLMRDALRLAEEQGNEHVRAIGRSAPNTLETLVEEQRRTA